VSLSIEAFAEAVGLLAVAAVGNDRLGPAPMQLRAQLGRRHVSTTNSITSIPTVIICRTAIIRSCFRRASSRQNFQQKREPASTSICSSPMAMAGNVPSTVETTLKVIGIRIWISSDYRQTADDVRLLQIRADDGHLVPLERIAEVSTVTGQPEIDRENLRRMVAVTARVQGRSVGTAAAEVENLLRKPNVIPKGVTYELGGLYKQQLIAMHDLTIVFLSALMLVFILLLFLYQSFLIAGLILTMPIIATGAAFIGLWLTGTERNITGMMGMTMVIGIITEIAIFYFSEYCELEEAHQSNSLVEAAVNRFRPIAMTTIAAILALLPISFALGQGSAMLQPLAITIISGLMVQIPLVLWIMPVAYSGLSNIRWSRARPQVHHV
jgi:multidrug efflux pump subunit AcrB